MSITPAQTKALEALGGNVTSDRNTVYFEFTSTPEEGSFEIQVHKLENGRWIIARYNDRISPRECHDLRTHRSSGFQFAVARSLETFSGMMVNTYDSPVKPIENAIRRLGYVQA